MAGGKSGAGRIATVKAAIKSQRTLSMLNIGQQMIIAVSFDDR